MQYCITEDQNPYPWLLLILSLCIQAFWFTNLSPLKRTKKKKKKFDISEF